MQRKRRINDEFVEFDGKKITYDDFCKLNYNKQKRDMNYNQYKVYNQKALTIGWDMILKEVTKKAEQLDQRNWFIKLISRIRMFFVFGK